MKHEKMRNNEQVQVRESYEEIYISHEETRSSCNSNNVCAISIGKNVSHFNQCNQLLIYFYLQNDTKIYLFLFHKLVHALAFSLSLSFW